MNLIVIKKITLLLRHHRLNLFLQSEQRSKLMGIAEVIPDILNHLSLLFIPMRIAHFKCSLNRLIIRQGEMRRHHIAISRHLATTALQLHRLDKQGYLGNLHGTLVQIYTIEIVLYDKLRNITATEVGTIVLHLIYIHVIEHGEGINEEVTTTAGRVDKSDIEHPILLRMAYLLFRRIGNQILGLTGFLINHKTAVRIHLQILLAQGIIHQELDYPLRSIDLTLEKNLIIFYFLSTLLELHLFYGIEVLIHPAQDIIPLPDILATLLIQFNAVECRDNLVEFIGSRQDSVRMVCLKERNTEIIEEFSKLISQEVFQSHSFSRSLLRVVFEPHLVRIRQIAMFCTSANHLRKEFSVFHHLHSRQSVEECKDTFLDSLLSSLSIIAHRSLVGSDDGIEHTSFNLLLIRQRLHRHCLLLQSQSRESIVNGLLNEASNFQNMVYQFHIYCILNFSKSI